MKIRQYSVLAALLLVLAGCGKPDSDSKGSSTSNGEPTAAVADSGVPENLKNAAYEYYGLGQEAPLTYIVKMSDVVPARDGTQTTTFDGMEDGAAKFLVTRTGGLSRVGSEVLLLDEEGVHTKAIGAGIGVLEAPALQVPADLGVGKEWESPMTITNGSQTIVNLVKFRAVREEKTTVEGGTFDCLVIEADVTSNVTGSLDPSQDGEGSSEIVAYYAKGIGTVKMTVKGTRADGTKLSIYVELKSIGEEK